MEIFEIALACVVGFIVIALVVWIAGHLIDSHERELKDVYIPKHASKKDIKKYYTNKKGK